MLNSDIRLPFVQRNVSIPDPRDKVNIGASGDFAISGHHRSNNTILAVSRDAQSGQYYIVMEFVEGGNLRDFLSIRKKLEVDPVRPRMILNEPAVGYRLVNPDR